MFHLYLLYFLRVLAKVTVTLKLAPHNYADIHIAINNEIHIYDSKD